MHLRYYLTGRIPTQLPWEPSYGPLNELLAEAAPGPQVDLALDFQRVLDAREGLISQEQRSFDRLLHDTFERLIRIVNSKHLTAELPMLLPEDKPVSKKRIPMAVDRDIARIRKEQKAKLQ